MSDVVSRCGGCIFTEMNKKGTQTGCSLSRAESLGIESIENGYYTLSRFCTTYRPADWLESLNLEESLDIKKTVLKEIEPRVGFFLYFEESLEDLQNILADIKNQEIPARYIVVMNEKVEYNEAIQDMLASNFIFEQTEYHIVQLLQKPENKIKTIDESFKHAKNGSVYCCHISERINNRLMQNINKRINLDLKKLVFVEPYDDNYNGLIFQTSLFKFLNGNSVKVFKDTTVDNRSFVDKVKHAAKNSSEETFITWSQFDES